MKKDYIGQLDGHVKNKVVLVTGASSGIGLTVAKMLANAGAHVLLLARSEETLKQVQQEIEANGGKASVFSCDLNDTNAIDECTKTILQQFTHVDLLINNAGRSIRRAVHESFERFHDFERTMQLNYFGAVRLILNLLPKMIYREQGHIINISSVGVLANATRYSAYVASKAALDAFGRCLSAEVRSHRISITSIYMPLVRTPMIAPTKIYNYIPVLSTEEAANLVAYAIIKKPKQVTTTLGRFATLAHTVAPEMTNKIMSMTFKMFPTSSVALGEESESEQAPSKVSLLNKAKHLLTRKKSKND